MINYHGNIFSLFLIIYFKMMINQNDKQLTTKSDSIKISLIIIIVLIGTFVIEILIRSYMLELSNEILSYLQQNKECEHWLFLLSLYIKILGHEYVFFAIIIIIFNRENIYKPFCLLNIIFYNEMLIGILKLIFAQKHPYQQSTDATPLIQTFNSNYRSYAFPSSSLLIAPVFYFSVLKMYVSNKAELIQRKIVGMVVICLIIFSIALAEFLLGYSNLNQIIFSITLSVLMYHFMYSVIRIYYSNASRQFHSLLIIPIKRIIGFNIFIWILILCLYYIGSFKVEEQQERKEAFCLCYLFFGNITLYFSLRAELVYYFNNSYNNWSQYNFDPQGEKQIIGNTLLNKISISRGVQWNKTVISKFIGRLLILLASALVCIAISYIGDIQTDNDWFVIIFKVIIPITLFSFTIGYGFKIVAMKFGLCNNNIFNMIRESI